MGHYDSLREMEREEENKRRDGESYLQLSEINEELSFEDREFLIKVSQNLDDFKAMFRLLKKFDQ